MTPKISDSKGKEHEAVCFGNYASSCGPIKAELPEMSIKGCPFAERCKNATPQYILDSSTKTRYIVKRNGFVREVANLE